MFPADVLGENRLIVALLHCVHSHSSPRRPLSGWVRFGGKRQNLAMIGVDHRRYEHLVVVSLRPVTVVLDATVLAVDLVRRGVACVIDSDQVMILEHGPALKNLFLTSDVFLRNLLILFASDAHRALHRPFQSDAWIRLKR